jgi:hypothetical protein
MASNSCSTLRCKCGPPCRSEKVEDTWGYDVRYQIGPETEGALCGLPP